jgi:acyl-CoA hydrolase
MYTTLDQALKRILAHAGTTLKVGAPLGLGKPNRLLNAIYDHAKAHPELRYELYTALALGLPKGKSELESRFLATFCERHFGADYPQLHHLQDLHAGQVPANVKIVEFYLQSGAWLGNAEMQRNYASLNYTHAAREVVRRGLNVLVVLVAERDGRYSLSSNPDTALDMLDLAAAQGLPKPLVVGCVHPELPFMPNDAEVGPEFFDLIVGPEAHRHQLFALPREPVQPVEHAIGVHAAGLLKDAGSIQIGIGALSDSLVHAALHRHRSPEAFARLYRTLSPESAEIAAQLGGLGRFERGLYGASEMVMDGFMHLVDAGIVRRLVYDDLAIEQAIDRGLIQPPEVRPDTVERMRDARLLQARLRHHELESLILHGLLPAGLSIDGLDLVFADGERVPHDLDAASTRDAIRRHSAGLELKNGHFLAGAFYLGSKALYRWMRELPEPIRRQINMTRVSHINQLYGGREALDAAQRDDARFFNTTMMVTALGAAVSETLADGRVVSGVGGQYNFVAMAHALPRGRSALLLRAVREGDGGARSNIVYNYPQVTIPRHLRDLVVTEYGVADLRGRTDEETLLALLAITDARFQPELIRQAQAAGKLRRDFTIPEAWKRNTPQRVADQLKASGLSFEVFPFGHDFDAGEFRLIKALKVLRTGMGGGLIDKLKLMAAGFTAPPADEEAAILLGRMGLAQPANLRERLYRGLLVHALKQTAG